MRKVVQYLAQKSAQDKVLDIQDWILAQRQKVLGKANLNRVLLLEALLVQWVGLLGRRSISVADGCIVGQILSVIQVVTSYARRFPLPP